ncbi:MAG: uroporphyrinogen-III C-methyltransferase [Candidatus Omnitrophica bacterium]|nr:uroporphyrinogen-III C-methyltransferase [Candidatus Omnitrophota bacterium]
MKKDRNKENFLIRFGSRQSPLAVVQVQEIVCLLKNQVIPFSYTLTTFQTAGDIDKTTALTKNIQDDFFTNTLDEALLSGSIDVAIHSAKDLPQKLNPNLVIAALTPCLDDSDAFVGNTPFEDLPARATIGTSSFLREGAIKSLRPDVTIVNIRGTIQERLEKVNQGKLDGIIVATCALMRLKLDHLIKSIFPWEGTPLQGQLAVVCRRDDVKSIAVFQHLDQRRRYGAVYLTGAGPGDPALITLKAIDVLKTADCVFYDYLVHPALLKYAVRAEHIYAGKRKGTHSIRQSDLCRLIRLKAMAGKTVVRLKGGDPFIFGRGWEELNYLRGYHIPVEVIPGISSATGLPSILGVPLTARGVSSSVSFISAHSHDESSQQAGPLEIPKTETVVVFMGLTKLAEIVKCFCAQGWSKDTPVMLISQGSRRSQRTVQGTLKTILSVVTGESIEPPALILVGKTVDFYQPSSGQKAYLFTGTHPKEYLGLGKIIPWPMIRIQSTRITEKARKKILQALSQAQLVLLTSEYAVDHFQNFLKHEGLQIKSIDGKEFAVIGTFTAQALLDHGAVPRFIPATETAQGVYTELKKRMRLKGLKIIYPRSSLPNPFLKEALLKSGAEVFEFAVYENIKPQRRPLPDEKIDGIIFTSPSTVHNFLKDYKKIPASWEILCKGPVSQKALAARGYHGQIISD